MSAADYVAYARWKAANARLAARIAREHEARAVTIDDDTCPHGQPVDAPCDDCAENHAYAIVANAIENGGF